MFSKNPATGWDFVDIRPSASCKPLKKTWEFQNIRENRGTSPNTNEDGTLQYEERK